MALGGHHEIRERLIAFLAELDVAVDTRTPDDAPLIDSGVLDSLGILKLALWVEQQVGRPLDPASLDLPGDWNTLERITTFIASRIDDDRSSAA